MTKTLAILVAGAFAATGAMAQQNPPGANVPPATPGIAISGPQQKAEMRKDLRPLGEVALAEDADRSAESMPIAAQGRAAAKGQANVQKRNARHPDAMKAGQGKTPQDPGAR